MRITIGVLSYNSEMFVEECLDSVAEQDFDLKLVDLIISDDGSVDNTKKIIENWLLDKANLFNSVIFISKIKNEGTVLNATSVLKETKTKWLKMIGADDLFEKKCLNYFKEFCPGNSIAVVVSKFMGFDKNDESNSILPNRLSKIVVRNSRENKKNKAIFWLMLGSTNIAPGAFINADILKKEGGFDTRYILLEDLPTWDKLINAGYHFAYLNKITVKYRKHEGQTVGRILNNKLRTDLILYARDVSERGFLEKIISAHRLYNISIASRNYNIDFYRLLLLALNPINIILRMIR